MQHDLPTGHVVFHNDQDWINEVDVKLSGRLTMERLAGSAGVPPNEAINAVGAGIIDGDITLPPCFAGRDPALAMLADLASGCGCRCYGLSVPMRYLYALAEATLL